MNTNAYTLSYAERVDCIYSVCSVSDGLMDILQDENRVRH